MNEVSVANINKYAKMLFDKKYLQSGYVALREGDGILITTSDADYSNIQEKDIVFVNDKNIESFEGNFQAAAVILFCVIRQDKKVNAAAIVDSDSILQFSSKRRTLRPILDDMAQVCGVTVKCASKNVAAEIVPCIAGQRNSVFMPDAGAVVTGRTLDEVYTATLVLDKATNAEILAEPKGGTQGMKGINAFLEHVVYKLKYSKKNQDQHREAEQAQGDGAEQEKPEEKKEERQSAIVTDEEKAIAQSIKDAGVRMLDEKLVQGTWGNIAVKLDDKFMLATPSGLDYEMLKPEQIAKVDMETLEWTGTDKATSEKGIHAALLKGNPDVGATVHTHPFYGCILAAMGNALPVPEQYRDILGNEIPCAAAALPGTKKLVKNVLAVIGDAPACFLAHHGVITRGKDLENALDICRALENACKAFLTE